MVCSADNEKGNLEYISISGEYRQAKTRQVSLALRGYFPVMLRQEYKASEVVLTLTRIVQTANAELPKILPLAPVIHARYSTDKWPRPLGFSFLCDNFEQLIGRSRGARRAPPVSRLAVYLTLAYHSLEFVRTKHSTFVAVPKNTMDSVSKVMYGLSRTELEHGVAELKQSQTTHSPESIAGRLQSFLQHWALWNDSRLTEAVQVVLKTSLGDTRPMDSHRALSTAVNRIKNIDLFPWVEPSDIKSSSVNSADSRPDILRHSLSVDAAMASHPPVRAQHSHLFTTNLVPGSVILSDSLAVSFDPEQSLLSIFIPRVPMIPSVLSPQSEVSCRSRTLLLKGTTCPLVSGKTAAKHKFSPGIESPAIRLQVKVDRTNRSMWDQNSVTAAIAETVPIEIRQPFHLKELTDVLESVPPVISDYESRIPTSQDFASQIPHSGVALRTHAQAAAGRIAGLYLRSRNMEGPFLVTHCGQEHISHKAGWHDRIKSDAYVPISRPSDSALALITQKKLISPGVPTLCYDGSKRTALDKKMQELVVPGLKLSDILEKRDRYCHVLQKLQNELQQSLIFHIFRCTLLESGSDYRRSEGELIKAHCIDIGLDVEVFVPANNEPVKEGDQIICTEILELDPLFGLMVLSM